MYAAPGLKKNSNGRPLGTINLQLCKLSCAKIIYLKRYKNMIVYLVALQDVIPCVYRTEWTSNIMSLRTGKRGYRKKVR